MCEKCDNQVKEIKEKAAEIAGEVGRVALKISTGVDPENAGKLKITDEQKAAVMEGLTVAFSHMGKSLGMPPEIMLIAALSSISNAYPEVGVRKLSENDMRMMGNEQSQPFGFVPNNNKTLH